MRINKINIVLLHLNRRDSSESCQTVYSCKVPADYGHAAMTPFTLYFSVYGPGLSHLVGFADARDLQKCDLAVCFLDVVLPGSVALFFNKLYEGRERILGFMFKLRWRVNILYHYCGWWNFVTSIGRFYL